MHALCQQRTHENPRTWPRRRSCAALAVCSKRVARTN